MHVGAQDIGVITPYFAQSRKIRKLLQKERIEGVKVSSVEDFQGQVCHGALSTICGTSLLTLGHRNEG